MYHLEGRSYLLKTLKASLKRYFLTGLLVITPIWGTILILKTLFVTVDSSAFKDAEAWPSRSFFIAVGYAQLGETDEAFAWLERGYREHDPLMFITSVSPFFDAIRVDPRFDDLLHRIGFPENESPAMLADVGYTLALAGRAEEAIARLDKALHLAPEDERLPRWRYSMAMAHFAAERYEQSVRWAQRALEDQTSSHSLAFAHLLLASSNAYLGQLDEAQ